MDRDNRYLVSRLDINNDEIRDIVESMVSITEGISATVEIIELLRNHPTSVEIMADHASEVLSHFIALRSCSIYNLGKSLMNVRHSDFNVDIGEGVKKKVKVTPPPSNGFGPDEIPF